MRKQIIFCVLVCFFSLQRLEAQFVVTDISAQIDRIIDRVTTAASQIRNFTEYKQIADAARALKTISNKIKNSEKVLDCFNLVADHATLYSNMYKTVQSDKMFTTAEKLKIRTNYIGYVNQSLKVFKDIKTAVIEGNASMNDKERIDLIDLVNQRLTQNYKNMYTYCQAIAAASSVRAASNYERNSKVTLYGTRN